MPAFYYIPKASLAAIIICAVAPMMDFHVVAKMWRIRSRCLLGFVLKCLSCGSVCLIVVWCSCDFHRAGPAAFCRDVPDELLAGAVRHHGRSSCIRSPAAVQHSKTPDKGMIIFFAGIFVSECMILQLWNTLILSKTYFLTDFCKGTLDSCLLSRYLIRWP